MKDLTSGSLSKNFTLFAVPLIFAALLSQAYSTVDTVIAGNYLGDAGLGAVGVTAQYITVASAVFWGYDAGAGIFVAKLFGAKNFVKLKNAIIGNTVFLSLVALVIGFISIVFKKPIYALLKVDKEILPEADIYFVIYIALLFVIMLSNLGVHFSNALGMSSFPFYMSIASAVVNIVGDIVTVAVFKMGTLGLAISTVLAAAVADLGYAVKLISCFKKMGVLNTKFDIDFATVKETFKYGIPTSAQQVIMYVASLVLSPVINGISVSATAAFSIANRIYTICATFFQNSSKTVSTYCAQCIGAEKYDGIKKGLKYGLVQALIFSLPLIIACSVFANGVCSVFLPEGYTGDTLGMAAFFARYCMPFSVIALINNLFHSYYRGIAQMNHLIISTAIGSVTKIASSILLVSRFGIIGIFIGWVISWIFELIYTGTLYFIKFNTTEKIIRQIKKTGIVS